MSKRAEIRGMEQREKLLKLGMRVMEILRDKSVGYHLAAEDIEAAARSLGLLGDEESKR